MDRLLPWRAVASAEPTVTGFLPLTVIATSLGNLSIWYGVSQPALLATPKLTEGGSEVEWVRAEPFGRARHSVRAELRALTIRTSHSARGAQRTALPYLFCDWRCKSVPVRSAHGFARPQKLASHDSAVDGRGKLILYHPSTACRRAKTNSAAQKLAMPCSPP